MNIIPIPLLPSKTFVLYILFFPVFFSRCDGLVYNISFLHICWYFVSGSWRTEFSGRTAHSSLVINLNLFKIETWFLKNREVGFLYNFSFSNLKLINKLHYDPLMMQQKEPRRKHPCVLPKKVAFVVWVPNSALIGNDGCYLRASCMLPACFLLYCYCRSRPD